MARLPILGLLLACLMFMPARGAWAADGDKPDPEKERLKAEEQKKAELKKAEEYYELYKAFADTLDQVERNYVKEVNRRELMEAAIRGMLTKLDPYSGYYGPDEVDAFNTAVESQFGGVGIQITVEAGQLRVLSPLVDSPAYKAGLQAGDRITQIEGKATDGVSIDEAVKRLKGAAGTSVKLTYVRAAAAPETVTLKREMIQVDTVLGERRADDDHWDFMLDSDKRIGYIRITAFSRDTTRDVKRALDKLTAAKMRGLVIDLRNNPGGLLTSAIEVADFFVSEGTIVSTEGRNSPARVWTAKKEGTFEGFPMVVLANRYSASASEIVAACLQDHKRAVILGERTWGKGSVQNVIGLEDGKSKLKLTTAGYLRPNGHNIHRFPDAKETDEWGVRPDDGFEIKITDAEAGRIAQDRRERDVVAVKVKKPSPVEGTPDSQVATPTEPGHDRSDAGKEPPAKVDAPPDKPDDPLPAKPMALATDKPAVAKPAEVIDRQLQKAIDYLTAELAKDK